MTSNGKKFYGLGVHPKTGEILVAKLRCTVANLDLWEDHALSPL